MQVTIRKLGEVLLHIYEYPFEEAIFLPKSGPYEADTPCIIGWDDREGRVLRKACLEHGLVNWLNVAVVSDTCDEVFPKDVVHLILAFNEDCQEGRWLHTMMNYVPPQE
jgi:hypothetical protein